jgi:hypothetical protein
MNALRRAASRARSTARAGGPAADEHRAWAPLDNTGIIFLATRDDVDPKVFRLTAELDHDVDAALLQQALDATYDAYPLFHAVLRRGFFWYYLEESGLRPRVTAEDRPVCAPIYRPGTAGLLFRVVYHQRRIVLEIFHALSDGTGASWFFSDLVAAYVRTRHADLVVSPDRGAAAPDRGAAAPDRGAVPERSRWQDPAHELVRDSFAHYFGGRGLPLLPISASGLREALWPRRADGRVGLPLVRPVRAIARMVRPSAASVHRVTGTRTCDARPRVVELTVSSREVLALARAEGVSLTMYLTAVFFEAVRRSSGGLGAARTLSASVPVNLRRVFPSASARNFFATVKVDHTYDDGPHDVGDVSRALEARFRVGSTRAALVRRVRSLIRVEEAVVVRMIPLVLKDGPLGVIGRTAGRGFTVAVSNLGVADLPGPIGAHVRRVFFHVSAVRPQVGVVSHAGRLTLSFTSPFEEVDHVREFARILTAKGIEATVAMGRVTEAELAEAHR